jgi:ABC-type nitrate/sulfonate/bicarbonate transport system substrate-binding protein
VTSPHMRSPVTRMALPRMSLRRRALVGAAWALAWTLVWASALMMFATKAGAQALSIAVSDGPVSLPVYVADARGFFKDEGVAVRLVECRSGQACYRLLADGQADLATASELLVAIGSGARPDIAILATLSASSYQIKLVARRSPSLAEAPQIRGRRVATVMGSSAQYFLDNWLVFNDVDPRTVTVVAQSPEHIVAALERRDVDAIAIWEPLAASAAAALGGEALVFASPRVYTQHFNLVSTRATIARREADVVKVLRALVRAQRAIAADAPAAAALLAARVGIPPALAAQEMADQDYRIRLDQSLVTTMQSQARWAARAGLAAAGGAHDVDLLRVIDASPLRKAASDAVGLVQ